MLSGEGVGYWQRRLKLWTLFAVDISASGSALVSVSGLLFCLDGYLPCFAVVCSCTPSHLRHLIPPLCVCVKLNAQLST